MSRVQIIDLEPKVMRRDSLFRELVRGLLAVFVILPLRLVAGRRPLLHRPLYDADRVAELELALGMREPMNVIEELSGISCPVEPEPPPGRASASPNVFREALGYQNIEQTAARCSSPSVSGGDLIGQFTDPDLTCTPNRPNRKRHQEYMLDRQSKAWRDQYERGQDKGRDILLHLDHDHEQIDVTAIGDREPRYIDGRCLRDSPPSVENLRRARLAIWEQARDLADRASTEHRGFTRDETLTWDVLNQQLDIMDRRLDAMLRPRRMNDVGLIEHLQFCLSAADPSERERARWVMNGEWYTECRGMADAGGRPLWRSESGILFGLPVDVRDDGGVPHLEPARDRG